MPRRLTLVAYDVADDRRRDRIARTLEGYGDRIQFSVFRCELNSRERVALRAAVSKILHHTEDQVLIVDLGRVTDRAHARLTTLGRPLLLRTRTQIV